VQVRGLKSARRLLQKTHLPRAGPALVPVRAGERGYQRVDISR